MTVKHTSNTTMKFADDTVVLGIITNSEKAYRDEVENLALWCQAHSLSLNVSKTNELVVDFSQKQQQTFTPPRINGGEGERL